MTRTRRVLRVHACTHQSYLPAISERVSSRRRVSLPTMVRLRLAAGLAVSLVTTSLAVNGLVRVLEAGIEKSGDDDDQWKHVRAHEERFIAALRSGTSAEGDDAGV